MGIEPLRVEHGLVYAATEVYADERHGNERRGLKKDVVVEGRVNELVVGARCVRAKAGRVVEQTVGDTTGKILAWREVRGSDGGRRECRRGVRWRR